MINIYFIHNGTRITQKITMRGVIFLPVFANSIAPNLIFGQTIIEDGKKWKENSIWTPPNQIGQLNNALAGLTQKAAFSPAEDWLSGFAAEKV